MNVRLHSRRVPGRTELFSAIAVVSDGRALHLFAPAAGRSDMATVTEIPLSEIAEIELDELGACPDA